jgi:AraC-binding-like domain
MTSHIPIDPLFRFPTVRTSDPEEFRNALISVYGARDLSVPDPTELKTRGNFLQLSDIALGFSACGARAMVTFDECNFVRMQIGLRGYASTVSGRATTTVHVA